MPYICTALDKAHLVNIAIHYITKTKMKKIVSLFALVAVLGLASCEENKQAAAQEAVENAAEATQEAAEKSVEAVQEAVENAAEAAQEATEKVVEEVPEVKAEEVK